jgi:hypothetical protein
MKLEKQILTTDEAATWLGVSTKELKRLMLAGHVRRLRGYHKPFKFSRVELERYLSAGVVA